MANIAEDVKAIIVEKLGVDASEVTDTIPRITIFPIDRP